jgi:hypothetical protein
MPVFTSLRCERVTPRVAESVRLPSCFHLQTPAWIRTVPFLKDALLLQQDDGLAFLYHASLHISVEIWRVN